MYLYSLEKLQVLANSYQIYRVSVLSINSAWQIWYFDFRRENRWQGLTVCFTFYIVYFLIINLFISKEYGPSGLRYNVIVIASPRLLPRMCFSPWWHLRTFPCNTFIIKFWTNELLPPQLNIEDTGKFPQTLSVFFVSSPHLPFQTSFSQAAHIFFF